MRLSKAIALALASAGCGGNVADVVIDAGNGCIITRPTNQSCIWNVTVSSAAACGTALDGGNLVDAGFETTYSAQVCAEICGETTRCTPDPGGNPDLVACGQGCIGGRSTAGAEGVGTAGHALARMAHLEATSVHAFAILEAELEAHGAPRALRGAARRAGRDEVRHARAIRALAHRYGAKTPRVRVHRGPVRPLVDVAIENATEGCVRELFGATIAAWQARHASDPAVRNVMRGIARDERRHAELAWRIAAWADSRLGEPGRRATRDTRRAAVLGLVRSCDAQLPDVPLGLPGRDAMRAMVRSLMATVWD